jgi:hypothetical protein
MTVRAMVAEAAADMRRGDLQPADLRVLLGRLTGLLGSCNEEIRHADAVYAGVLLQLLESHEAANRARIRAQTTPEYQRVREARDTKEACVEMVRAIKYQLRSADEEMRLTR